MYDIGPANYSVLNISSVAIICLLRMVSALVFDFGFWFWFKPKPFRIDFGLTSQDGIGFGF